MALARPAAWKWPDPVPWAIVALMAAAALTLYLQHRDVQTQNRQTARILEQVSAQAASSVAIEIRRIFEAPVFDTLAAVNHPLLQSGRFDLVAREFADGLASYPQLDRFFIWHEMIDATFPGEALFYGGRPAADEATSALRPDMWRAPAARAAATSPGLDGFYRDPAFGRLVLEVARAQSKSQWIYGAEERRIGSATYDLFLRIFWSDAARDDFFAVMGFAVSHARVRGWVFEELYRRKLISLLEPGESAGSPDLELTILDDQDRVVFGGPEAPVARAGRATFALRFYPSDEIRARMAGEVPLRTWQVVVTPAAAALAAMPAGGARGYWLSGGSVLLMIVALALVLRGRRRASQLSRMQTEFVSQVSHQLKTPLSLLSAATETLDLERVRSPAKLAEYLKMMRTESHRLSLLVDRILEFSRVQDRRRVYELEAIDLVLLVRETVEAFDGALPGARIRVDVPDRPPVIAADPAAIEQVLANLLDNAVKYSPREKPITVAVTTVGREAIVEVRDAGIGIAPEERDKIFERFYRGSGAALHHQGFGLGLAIVREIVTAHHGQIEVDSARGHGTTFRVRLPLMAHEDVESSQGQAGRAMAGPSAPPLRAARERIL
jgi:signal transduction histidine kinase